MFAIDVMPASWPGKRKLFRDLDPDKSDEILLFDLGS
jgi:hypothetical protein